MRRNDTLIIESLLWCLNPHLIYSGEEVEDITSVSYKTIIKELGLPIDISGDEKLGILRKQYGFEMSEVRKIIQKYENVK